MGSRPFSLGVAMRGALVAVVIAALASAALAEEGEGLPLGDPSPPGSECSRDCRQGGSWKVGPWTIVRSPLEEVREQIAAGEYEQARIALDELISAYPSRPGIDEALYFLGVAYTVDDAPRSALSVFAKLIDRYPASQYADDALYETAHRQAELEDRPSAVASLRRLVDEYGGSEHRENALYFIAAWSSLLRDYESTLRALEELGEPETTSSLRLMLLRSQAYEALGREEEARKLWDETLVPPGLGDFWLPGEFEDVLRRRRRDPAPDP